MSNKLYIIKNDAGIVSFYNNLEKAKAELKIITVDYKLHSYEINKYELIDDVYINMFEDFEEPPMNETKLTDDEFVETTMNENKLTDDEFVEMFGCDKKTYDKLLCENEYKILKERDRMFFNDDCDENTFECDDDYTD